MCNTDNFFVNMCTQELSGIHEEIPSEIVSSEDEEEDEEEEEEEDIDNSGVFSKT